MAPYRIVGFVQVHNELRKGNLERFLRHFTPLVDALVMFDDASTDGSFEYVLRWTPHVIRGVRNEFKNELEHKQALLELALTLSPDFILWLDVDEVLTATATRERLQELCWQCVNEELDGLSFHELNLWRNPPWRRVDSLYDDGWFVRLWRVRPRMRFDLSVSGLHRCLVPICIRNVARVEDVAVLHYGFSSDKALAYKYLTYKSHGQAGELLSRLLDETTLELVECPRQLFPEGLHTEGLQPEKRTFEEALRSIDVYRAEVFAPGVSIICLIYKSTRWLDFVYDQVLRYTDLTNKEFFFVANDASDAVVRHLREHYIPYVVWNNTAAQRQEWFINNVYRAFNHGARVARGDYLLFVNSDMAFSPGWFERLFEKMDGRSCVVSRLVESGKLASGTYGISRDFGRSPDGYDENAFVAYSQAIEKPGTGPGGLFMPLLIRKEDFWRVGGYPEGNIVPGCDLRDPQIANQGEPCVSGDQVLMRKLHAVDVEHKTALDSIVYHFQCGEQGSPDEHEPTRPVEPVVICNDRLTGSMGEKTMWDFLVEALPGARGVDERVVGTGDDLATRVRRFIRRTYPEAGIVIQNATFLNLIDQDKYTIAYLQDNLRGMGRPSPQQEHNLRLANLLVSNSRLTALSYPEFEFEIIPIGVDDQLFRPMDKSRLRREMGLPNTRTGIFVGDYSEVKGWSRVRRIIKSRPDLFWILVSKDYSTHEASNCRCYNRIDQHTLAKLLNCADFFIVGSAVETECLAAIEACMCGIPIVMRNTGIFADFTDKERRLVGALGDDLDQAINLALEGSFSPREVVVGKGLTVEGMVGRWTRLLERVHLAVASRKEHRRFSAGTAVGKVERQLPLVSIVTPAYNRAPYLEETIQSVLAQNYHRIEYIILDDGSTDNTGEILSHYAGRITWETHPNMGETQTVNKGIGMAHGEIIAIVNSDDPLMPGAVSSAVEFLREHPEILVAYPDWRKIDRHSHLVEHVKVPEYNFLHMVRRHDCVVGPGAFIRRRAFELVSGRDPNYRYVADFAFWLQLGLHGAFARIPLELATFRVHPQSASVSARGRQMANEHIRLIQHFFAQPGLPLDVKRVRREAFAWAHLVAADACGSDRWTATRHRLLALAYAPTRIVSAAVLRRARAVLPEWARRPLRKLLRALRSAGTELA